MPIPSPGPFPSTPTAPAVIGFTSGTTRDPKGVIHSHRTLGCEMRQLDHLFPGGGPPQITGAPVGHFIGMLNAFLVPLLRDRPVTLIDVWDPGEVLRLMRAEGLGVSGGATFFLTSLLDHPDFTPEHLALMPFAGLGGSAVPIAVMQRITDLGMRAFRSYGSTEHPSITGCLLDDPEAKRHHHRRPGPPRRRDPPRRRGPDPQPRPGLLRRLHRPRADRDRLRRRRWYRTGDVGVLDDDGYLAITDRIADVIIRGGENISAVEVEELLMGLAAVAEVSVVAAPDARLGEHAAAVVRLREGAAAPTLDEVRAHLDAAGLARQKWPEAIYAVADLPRTPSGKVQKFRLRQQLRDGELDAARRPRRLNRTERRTRIAVSAVAAAGPREIDDRHHETRSVT